MIPGNLSDHYDPREKVLRLSQDVYENRSLAAVGIAAHESGHALQDAKHYAPLAVRNLAVSAAGFGSGLGILIFIGLVAFGAVVVFQLVNLPVEFDASNRAKRELVQLGIVPQAEMPYVNDVLNAAAWTYVAATLEAILILLYYVLMFAGRSRRD
jgi:Zn-dependent membrane protease YugP